MASHHADAENHLGDFKGYSYLPEFHAMMDWRGWDFFAPESLLTPDGLHVYCDDSGNGGFPIVVESAAKLLRLGDLKVPFALRADENLTLRVFLDKSMIEVFANDRQAAVAPYNYEPGNLAVSIVSKGGDATVKEVTGWKLKSIY